MTPDIFYSSEIREIYNWIQGHRMLQWERSEDLWNMTRIAVINLLSPYMKKGMTVKPTDYVVLHMDGFRQKDDPYNQQKIREWSELMDSIPFCDPSEYDYN